MKSLRVVFILLSIAIFVVPMAGLFLFYGNNLTGAVMPSEVKKLMSDSENGNMPFAPQPVGNPVYNPVTNTMSFSFSFKNPLSSKITVDYIYADVVSKTDNILTDHVNVGRINLDNPIIINPGQNVTITLDGTLTSGAMTFFETYLASDPNNDDLNVELANLNVEAGGVHVYLEKIDAGWVMLKGVI